MEKRRNKLLSVLTLVGIITIAGFAILGSSQLDKEIPVTTDLAYYADTEIPLEDVSVDIISPDEKSTLTVKKSGEVEGVITQTFYIKSEGDETSVKIFERESKSDNLISVPENTFSPNNKYIFLKYEDSGKTRYIVLRTDGEELKEGSQTVEIESLFSEKHPDYRITDVTGWGGYTLIVVNTNTVDGKTGPSWWFDLSNFSFIRLSSRFN
jgi:hypothetical protein